jgi:hypothetical protein
MSQIYNFAAPDGAEEELAASPVQRAINRVRRPKALVAAMQHWRQMQTGYSVLHDQLKSAIVVMRNARPAEVARFAQRVREIDAELKKLGEGVKAALTAVSDGRTEYAERVVSETKPLRQNLSLIAFTAGTEFLRALDELAELDRALIAVGAPLQRGFPNHDGLLHTPLALLRKHAENA